MTVLSAEALSVTAADGSVLLDDVDLEIDPGETVLVCGPSGSGKTMLVKAMKGLLDDRDDLGVHGTVRRSGAIGYVSQSPGTQLVRRTVRHDIAFGPENRCVPPDEIEARTDRVAQRLDAEHLLDRRTRHLSAGETALVALLGVLVMEPAVVVLDEPLAPLDLRNTRLVLDAIDRLRESGTAVVVAEHDVRDLLRRGDHVVLLDEGRVGGSGPPGELASELYRAGVTVPFPTAVAAERAGDGPAGDPPISTDADGVDPS